MAARPGKWASVRTSGEASGSQRSWEDDGHSRVLPNGATMLSTGRGCTKLDRHSLLFAAQPDSFHSLEVAWTRILYKQWRRPGKTRPRGGAGDRGDPVCIGLDSEEGVRGGTLRIGNAYYTNAVFRVIFGWVVSWVILKNVPSAIQL